ncbi:MAG: hypothetical protein PF443_06145 [Allgaiera sp.]|jgi:hypothetical protein|nr:hypothetical protein [Allgaiera sp.]
MTRNSLGQPKLSQKHDQAGFLRRIAEAVHQPIMKANVSGPIGAGRHEPDCDRAT